MDSVISSKTVKTHSGWKLFTSFVEIRFWSLICACLFQKSPAKKLGRAISKSFGCVPSREPSHPVYPEYPEKPLNLSNIV